MMPKDVNATAIAVVVEAHLDPDLPAEGVEQLHGALDERRMLGVHEAVELLAAPADHQLARRAERVQDPGHGPHVHAGEIAALDARHGLPGDRRPLSEVGLAPSPSAPKVPNCPWEVGAQHRPMMARRTYRPLISQLRPTTPQP